MKNPPLPADFSLLDTVILILKSAILSAARGVIEDCDQDVVTYFAEATADDNNEMCQNC